MSISQYCPLRIMKTRTNYAYTYCTTCTFHSRLENTIENKRKEHEAERKKAKEESDRAMIELADQYKQKLIVEYQRFETLDEQYKTLKKSYSKKLATMESQKEQEVKRIREEHNKKLDDKEHEVGEYSV